MPGSVLPGPIRQIGYVVRDFDSTLSHWVELGVGPWYVMRGITQAGLYRGEPCTVTLTIGFANSGDMQIEVIHQDDDTASIYQEFLDAGGDGYHQLAYWAENYDEALAAGQAVGWSVVWSGGDATSARYAYFVPPVGTAPIVELMELTESSAWLVDFVRSAAADWDGSDPIRSLV